MGSGNARAALAYPGKLTPSARLVLVYMATMTRDRDTDTGPARLYYGGLENIVLGIGRTKSRTQNREVLRCLAALSECGLVSRISSAGRGHAAVYRLNLGVDNRSQSVDKGG